MANHTLPTKPNDPNYIPPAPRRARPGYRRIIVDWRPIPMQAAHVPCPSGKTRCETCWLALANPKAWHFCRWRIVHEGERAPSPPMRYAPVYRWVRDP